MLLCGIAAPLFQTRLLRQGTVLCEMSGSVPPMQLPRHHPPGSTQSQASVLSPGIAGLLFQGNRTWARLRPVLSGSPPFYLPSSYL